METDAYDRTIYRPGIIEEAAQMEYLDVLASKAAYWREIGVTADDNIVLLSTCASYTTNGRYILVGRIGNQVFENTFAAEDSANQTHGMPGVSFLGILPVWVWVFLLLLLVVITILIVYRIRKSKEKEERADEQNET